MKRAAEQNTYIACLPDVSQHASVSACVSTRRAEKDGRKINPGSLFPLFALYRLLFFSFFFFFPLSLSLSIIQGMKAGVSWHGRIKEGDALNAASLSTRDKEQEGGDNKQKGQKQDF